MKNKIFWTLSLSKMLGKKEIRLKIESSISVPPKGEVKQILGLFKEEAHAEAAETAMHTDFLLTRWGKFFFLEYREGHVVIIGERRIAEIMDEFLS